jgi:hypothetical protein
MTYSPNTPALAIGAAIAMIAHFVGYEVAAACGVAFAMLSQFKF